MSSVNLRVLAVGTIEFLKSISNVQPLAMHLETARGNFSFFFFRVIRVCSLQRAIIFLRKCSLRGYPLLQFDNSFRFATIHCIATSLLIQLTLSLYVICRSDAYQYRGTAKHQGES